MDHTEVNRNKKPSRWKNKSHVDAERGNCELIKGKVMFSVGKVDEMRFRLKRFESFERFRQVCGHYDFFSATFSLGVIVSSTIIICLDIFVENNR